MADLEIRAEGDGMTFQGYAAVFNSDSEDLGGFRERIQPGAFTRTLKRDRNIRMFLNHNTDTLLATTGAGTLRLSEDEKGLAVSADLPDTTAGRDLATLLRRGDVNSMSFGFQVVKDEWAQDDTQRTLREVRLFEVSPITGWPAYPATTAAVRSLTDVAARLLADPAALAAAVAKLSNGEPLTMAERDLLSDVIDDLAGMPDGDMAMDSFPLLAEMRARFAQKGLTL